MYAVLRLNESTTPLIFSLIRMFQDDFSNIALVCVDPVLVVSTACVHSCNRARSEASIFTSIALLINSSNVQEVLDHP